MIYGTIEEEAASCREAFKGSKVGDVVWFCHHDTVIEMLKEPAENRIDYILSYKDIGERAVRLHWFRPFTGEIPAEWKKAYAELKKADAELKKAYAERDKAYAEWKKADAELKKADAERDKAYAERDKAYAERDKAYAEWKKTITVEHVQIQLPGCPWDGSTLLTEVR